jgi:hypothetical protein
VNRLGLERERKRGTKVGGFTSSVESSSLSDRSLDVIWVLLLGQRHVSASECRLPAGLLEARRMQVQANLDSIVRGCNCSSPRRLLEVDGSHV